MSVVKKSTYDKGKDLIIQEKYDEALKYFGDLHEKHKDDAIISNYIGIIYVLKEEYKKAADNFKKSIEIDPNNWYSYQRLGQICAIKNIDKCAIDYFTQTIELDPSNITAYLNLAMIFQNQDLEISKDLISSALKVDPVNLIANYLMGSLCINTCDYNEAEELLEKVVTNNPEFFMGWYKLGVLYFKSNKLKKAVEALNNAVSITKKPFILNLLGLIYLYLFKIEEAVVHFKASIKINPKDPNPWINLADAYYKGKKVESAKMILKEALDLIEERSDDKDINKEIAIWLNFANYFEEDTQLGNMFYALEKARDLSMKTLDPDIEFLDQDKSKMETLYRINQKLDDLKSKGVEPKRPELLNRI
jgi:tetratricopeptide (TPR) repeat protein